MNVQGYVFGTLLFSVGNDGYTQFPDKTNLHMSEGSKDWIISSLAPLELNSLLPHFGGARETFQLIHHGRNQPGQIKTLFILFP